MTSKVDLPFWATRRELAKLIGVDTLTIRRWVRKGFVKPHVEASKNKICFYIPSAFFDIERHCLPMGPIARDLRRAYVESGYLYEAPNAKTIEQAYRG